MNKINLNDYFFTEINTEANAWCLGLMFSDGNVDKDRPRFSITLCDIDVIDKFKYCIKYEGSITSFSTIRNGNKCKEAYRIRSTSKQIVSDLAKYGCTPVKSKTLEFPTQLPENMQSHFIRGVFDGDGSMILTGKTSNAPIHRTM